MNNIILIVKGFFIGIANIIPGVSGGTLMISLGIFEQLIDAISHFFKNFKKNIKFLFWIGIGAVLSIILVSRVVTFTLENYRFPTILFFIGLIIGGIPMLFKTVKKDTKKPQNILIFALMFGLIMLMTFFEGGLSTVSFTNMSITSYIILFLIGVIAAATMVVPGLSGSFMLILLGYYEPILNTIKEFTSFNDPISNGIILGIFALGVLIGIVLVAKLIEYLLDNHKIITYFGILGFVFASIISIIVTGINDGMMFTPYQIIAAIPLFLTGLTISYKLGEKE